MAAPAADRATLAAVGALGLLLTVEPWLQVTAFGDIEAAPKQALLFLATAGLVAAVLWRGPPAGLPWWAWTGGAAFVAGVGLSYAAAVDQRVALLGWYGYRLGALTLVCGPVLLIGTAVTAARGMRQPLLACGALGAMAVVAFAFLQTTGASGYFTDTTSANRNNGGTGTPNDLAAYLALALAFAPAAFRRGRLWGAGYVAALSFGTALSESRAGFVTFLASGGLLAVLLVVKSPSGAVLRRGGLVGAAMLAGFLVSIPTGTGLTLLGRFTAPAPATSAAVPLELAESYEIRLSLWKGGLQTAAAEPLLGHGQDSLPFVFGEHREPGDKVLDTLPPRLVGSSHNLLIDLAANDGLLALSGWVLLVAPALLIALWRARRRPEADLWCLAGIGGYLVLQMVNPWSVAGMAMFSIAAGLLVGTGELKPYGARGVRAVVRPLAIVPVVAAIAFGVLLTRAELAAGRALALDRSGKYGAESAEWARVADILPMERTYGELRVRALANLAAQSKSPRDLSVAAAAGREFRETFAPLPGNLVLEAVLISMAEPESPEVDQLLAQIRAMEPYSAYWPAKIEELLPGRSPYAKH